MNQTGIAWVNMPGTGIKFSYSKSINGKKINFIEDDIYTILNSIKSFKSRGMGLKSKDSLDSEFCSKCGSKIDSGAKFCQTCGNPIKN